MKTKLLFAIALAASVTMTSGQGTIQLQNDILTRFRLHRADGTWLNIPVGTPLNFGLFWGVDADGVRADNDPVLPMGSMGTTAGVMTAPNGNSYAVENAQPGQPIFVQVRGWSSSFGADWRAAMLAWQSGVAGAIYGETDIRQLGGTGLGPEAGPGAILWQSASGSDPNRLHPLEVYENGITVPAAADTFIYSGSPDNNAGSNSWFGAGTDGHGETRRGLLRFNLGSIPPGSVISAAELRLTVTRVPPTPVHSTFDLFRLEAGWNEGDKQSNTGLPATAGEATWNARMFGAATWSVPGAAADAASTASASAAVGSSVGQVITWTSPALAADAQFWLDNPAQNFGWLLTSGAEGSLRSVRGFIAREAGVGAGALVVTYTLPPATNMLPSVAISSPTNGASFTAAAPVVIEATASDPDGSVTQVEFFDASTSLGVDITSPYRTTNNLAPGIHALTAVAWDNRGAFSTSAVVNVTVVLLNPTITNCTSRGNCHAVYAQYNRPMNLDGVYTITCSNTVNGTVQPVVVVGIRYGHTSNEVCLSVTPDLLPDTNVYCMTVVGATSRDGLAIHPNPQTYCFIHGAEYSQWQVLFERYDDVGNGNLAAFLSSPKYLDHQPDAVVPNPTGFFETPSNIRDNYGGRIFGFYIAPQDGNYFFWMSSDDQGSTYIATDADPAHKVQIGSEPEWGLVRAWADAGHDINGNRGNPPANGSVGNGFPNGIPLSAGRKVYLEGLFSEGPGDDNYGLTVKINDPSAPPNGFLPISGDQFMRMRLSPDGTIFTTLCDVFCNPGPSDQTTVVGQAATFRATPDGTPPYMPRWMKNGVPIPGANAATYTTPPATLADDGAMFTFLVANDFSTNQCSAVLRVRPATALSITRLADRVVLSWQASALSYRLQSANAFPTNNTWTPVPGSPIVGGGVYRITNSISGAQKFYRLIGP